MVVAAAAAVVVVVVADRSGQYATGTCTETGSDIGAKWGGLLVLPLVLLLVLLLVLQIWFVGAFEFEFATTRPPPELEGTGGEIAGGLAGGLASGFQPWVGP